MRSDFGAVREGLVACYEGVLASGTPEAYRLPATKIDSRVKSAQQAHKVALNSVRATPRLQRRLVDVGSRADRLSSEVIEVAIDDIQRVKAVASLRPEAHFDRRRNLFWG
jgi:hypothetical protein